MPRILLLVLVATVLTARPALAESWVLVTRDDKGTDYYIDTESVQPEGSNGSYLFWRMSVQAKPDENGIVADKNVCVNKLSSQGLETQGRCSVQ